MCNGCVFQFFGKSVMCGRWMAVGVECICDVNEVDGWSFYRDGNH